MKNKLLIITSLLLSQFLVSQEYNHDFGQVSEEEMEMTKYDKDPDAEAVVLYDIGKAEFVNAKGGGYDIKFVRKKRIKILDRSAISRGEISIPYYVDDHGEEEKVSMIKAFSYNIEDGRFMRKELDKSTIYDEQTSKYWRAKKFAFPGVKEGTVIEYTYTLLSPFHFNLPDWYFQDIIPTVYSEYQVSMIPFYEYAFIAQGIYKFDYQHSEIGTKTRVWGTVNESYGENHGTGVKFKDYNHLYVMKDVPAFNDESYITSINDYVMKMDCQLAKVAYPHNPIHKIITTWTELNEALLRNDHFGKYIKGCKKYAKAIVESENIEKLSEQEKVNTIINYVKTNFSWNGYNSIYAAKSPKEFINQKSGSSGNINLFMIALLNQAGIEAYPVILSTRDHGKIKADYPFGHYFNYVLAYINSDNSQLADGTSNLLPNNMIPVNCINDKGLIVKKDEDNWLELSNNSISLSIKQITLDIDTEEVIANASVTMHTTGYKSSEFKNSFKDNLEVLKESFEDGIFDEVYKVKTVNFDRPSRPYIISFEGEKEIEIIGDNIIVSPFLNIVAKDSKLKKKERTYPVDFVYPQSEEFNIFINIPEGYEATSLPEDFSMNNSLAAISIKYINNDGKITIKGSYTIKKSIYEPGEYSKIKYYLLMISKKFNEQIVIMKL